MNYHSIDAEAQSALEPALVFHGLELFQDGLILAQQLLHGLVRRFQDILLLLFEVLDTVGEFFAELLQLLFGFSLEFGAGLAQIGYPIN